MALSASPRKIVPLSSGNDSHSSKHNSSGPSITKRVFFCGVVVENSEGGRRLPQDVQDLVVSLGEPLGVTPQNSILSSNSDPNTDNNSEIPRRKRAMTDTSALADVVNELVNTERSYVKRLQTLKHDYADPLRKFSRSKDTMILPPYEAKTLFGNVDNLLPVNEAFLIDLEKMMVPNGAKLVGGVGDVALRHFKEIRGFEHYKQYYVKREEAQSIFEREVAKKSSGFSAFIDRIKYSSADTRNRVGLRELLMDPVQRIPRYTLMFRTMIKFMSPDDPQRTKLVEADEIASKIALAETDEQTKRATIMYCLSATVDGFPPGLISNSRRFVDCIDVEDTETVPTASGPTSVLHCTLFLFDDKLMVVKRPGNGEKSGRVLAGLDEMEKSTKSGGLPLGKKKSGMSCKGIIDIMDIVATDVGGADIHLYLENLPLGQTDRWLGRPFRSLSVVHPPSPVYLDPTKTEADKKRFLENLWHVQAMYRTKAGQSVVLCAEEREVESRGGRVTLARTYFNVFQRTAFLQESKKTKVVVHVDSLGSADPIPFGLNAPPFVVIRVQPMAGELSRYTVTSSDPNDEGEEDIVQTTRVPARVVQTIHQFGLFKFRTGHNSIPSTPTTSTRSRAAIFGLDAISRKLFDARPGSSKGDIFGGSISSHRRSKSTISRSSMYTQTTADGSLMKFSHRSNSTATHATTMSIMDDESFVGSRSSSRSRKLLKRGKSPSGSGSEPERALSTTQVHSLANRRSQNTLSEPEYSDFDDDEETVLQNINDRLDQSELDLTKRLELARHNSQNQHGKRIVGLDLEHPVEDTIYEEGAPQSMRPVSRASRNTDNTHLTSEDELESLHRSRSTSRQSSERRPAGPRSPSPLPPRTLTKATTELPSMDAELAIENMATGTNQSATTGTPADNILSPLPRSKRLPFISLDTTPKPTLHSTTAPPGSVEPLSIRKKSSIRSSGYGTPTSSRKAYTRVSPKQRPARIVSPRKVSPQIRSTRIAHSSASDEALERLLHLSKITKEDVVSSRRAVKRIKLEIDTYSSNEQQSGTEILRPSSPDKGLQTPQRGGTPMTKAALDRMEEMRQMIQKRQGESTPRSRQRSITSSDGLTDSLLYSVENLATEAENDLTRAVSSHEVLQNDIELLAAEFKLKLSELEKTRLELQNTKRQCELVKSLLADTTAEKEIMYEAFNEELDSMFNDASLPEDEAWAGMTKDLQRTKENRNTLSQENSRLKRRIAEIESQQQEWEVLLRTHRLIS